MYKELSTYDVMHELHDNKDNGFSRAGAFALAEYLEQYEEDTGEKIKLDTVAIRCEYSEYSTAYEAMQQYQPEDMPICEDTGVDENGHGMDLVEISDATEKMCIEWLEERTTVIPFEGGVIIADF